AAKRLNLLADGGLDPALIGTGWRTRRGAVEAAAGADGADIADTADSADTPSADTADNVRTGAPHPPEPGDPSAEYGSITVEDAARLLMLSGQWVRQLVKKGFIPKPEGGRVPLAGAVRGYIRFLKGRGAARHEKRGPVPDRRGARRGDRAARRAQE